MLIPLTCSANEWTTLPPPLCLSDIERLVDATEQLRSKYSDDELRGLEPVIQVWFNCECVFTQDLIEGYAWLPECQSGAVKKMRVALMDGTMPRFWQYLQWPEPDRIADPL
jgi:hypothetical protein